MRHSFLIAGAMVGTLLGTGGTLTYYEEAAPTTMNPLFANTMVDRRTHELVFDRLFYRSAITRELRSRLVSSHERTEDGRGLTLTLVEGVAWHDGTPVKPSDICFTVDAMLDPSTPSPIAKPFREVLEGCTSDKKTATVHFKRAFHNPRERLSFHLLPGHKFETTAIQPDTEFSLRPVGTGSMKGAKGRQGVLLTATASPQHGAQIPEARLAEGGDPLVQVRTLLNGGVQGIVSVAPPYRPDVAASDDSTLKSYDLRSWWYMAVNIHMGALSDVRVRQALNIALDRLELRELTMGIDPDDPIPACQFISGPFVQSSPYYNRSVSVEERSDKGRVRELMTEAGATEAGGRWVFGDTPLQLRVGMNSRLDREARDLLNQVGNQLGAMGFGQEVHKVKNDEWVSKVVTGGRKGDFELLIGKWSFGVVENVSPLFHTRTGGRGSLNLFNYSDAKVDAYLEEWDQAVTDTEAQDAYHALHRHLSRELPYLFLWKLDTKSAWRQEVRGNVITPYYYFTEFDGWTL